MSESESELAQALNELAERVGVVEEQLGRLTGQPPASRPAWRPEPIADTRELDALQAKNAKLLADYEQIEGEYQALKLRADLGGARAGSSPPAPAAPAADPGGRPMAKISVVDLAKLRMQVNKLKTDNHKLETRLKKGGAESGLGAVSPTGDETEEVARIKHKATRTIKRLQTEADTARLQSENLRKMLASRDSGESGVPELTLEQITDSPVFKTMLGNIRRTSREEVTLLHDAIVKLGESDSEAYNAVLPVVDAIFKAAKVENPLALLPKK